MAWIECHLASHKNGLAHLVPASCFYLVQAGTRLYKMTQANCDSTDEGVIFGPKNLEQTTLSYIHFIENAQAKPSQAKATLTGGCGSVCWPV